MFDSDDLPPPRRLPEHRREAVRELLVARVRPRRPWWRRPGRGVLVGAGALGLVLGGGAASAYVAFKPASDTGSVYCYTVASLDAGDQSRIRVAPADAGPNGAAAGPAAVTDPVGTCAGMWRTGLLRPGVNGISPDEARRENARPVPPLVACTLREGVAGVFPGGKDTCARLGLPRTTH